MQPGEARPQGTEHDGEGWRGDLSGGRDKQTLTSPPCNLDKFLRSYLIFSF